MKVQDFSWSVYDTCVYMKKLHNEIFNLIILVPFVDDMLMSAKNQSNIDICKNKLNSALKMKDLITVKKY